MTPDVFEAEEIRRQDEAIWLVMSLLHIVGCLTAAALANPLTIAISFAGLLASLRLWADARGR